MRRLTAFVALFLLSIAGSATTVVPMSIERLTDASTHVVEGVAAESHSAWNMQHTQIFTYTAFRVMRALKGTSPATIVVKQMGGAVNGYEQKVAGVCQFQNGEHAVLFVHPSQSNDGTVVITGLMQGKFSVVTPMHGEATVSNGMAHVDERSNGSFSHYAGVHMRLSQLEALVLNRSQK